MLLSSECLRIVEAMYCRLYYRWFVYTVWKRSTTMTVVLFSYTIHVSSQREHSPFKSRWIYLFGRFCGSFCAERYMRVYKRVDYRIYLHSISAWIKDNEQKWEYVQSTHTLYTYRLALARIFELRRTSFCVALLVLHLKSLVYELKWGCDANIYSDGKVSFLHRYGLEGILSTKLLYFMYDRSLSYWINVICLICQMQTRTNLS